MWSQCAIVLASIGLKDRPNIEAGIDVLQTTYGNHEDFAEATYLIARGLNHLDSEEAKQLYERVIDDDKRGRLSVLAEVNLGAIMLRAGDEKGARAAFDEILKQHKGEAVLPEAVVLMADAYWSQACQRQSTVPSFLQNGSNSEYEDYVRKMLVACERVINEMAEAEFHTADAYILGAQCHRQLGEFAQAVEKYQVITERWPDYEKAPFAQFAIARCLEELMKSDAMPGGEAIEGMRDACWKVTTYYPDSMAASAAVTLLNRWERRSIEGRQQ